MSKLKFVLPVLLLLSFQSFAHESGNIVEKTVVKNGIGLGSMIAVVISWDRNKSILLAILHGVFGWLYVIYYFLFLSDR